MLTVHTIAHKHADMYLIDVDGGCLLFDCGWQDSFPVIKAALREYGVSFGRLIGVFVSHLHPDHAGTLELLRRHGVRPLILERQTPYVGWLNEFFTNPKNDPNDDYVPFDSNSVTPLTVGGVQELLRKNGIDGEILYTPGHSEGSISLIIGKSAFIGDLQRYDGAESLRVGKHCASAELKKYMRDTRCHHLRMPDKIITPFYEDKLIDIYYF